MYHKETFAPINSLTGKCHKATPTNADKWKYTLCTTFLFLLITNPATYNLTTKLTGLKLSVNGCPTTVGLYTHALVFTLLLRAMMG